MRVLSTATLVQAFVTSRIDYGNALLANAPRTISDKLNRVLKAAARVITGTRGSGTDAQSSHWTALAGRPQAQRVILKLCTTVYKCLHGLAPQYFAELCACRGRTSSSSSLCFPWSSEYPRYNLSNYRVAQKMAQLFWYTLTRRLL